MHLLDNTDVKIVCTSLMIIFSEPKLCCERTSARKEFLAAALCTPGVVFLKRSPQMDIFRGKKQLLLFVKTTSSVSGLS